jgi:hypothetical protein
MTGACAGSANATGASTVGFGENMAVSCTTSFATAADLANFCTARTPPSKQPLIAALNLTAATRIGVYGDSHPITEADWVPLTIRYPNGADASLLTTVWDATTQTCSNVLSGIHVRVLTAEVGRVSTPISKVIGAELSFTSRSLSATRCALGAAPCPTVMTTSATTTFAAVDSQSFNFVPESPQLIPPLPHDFFYPFFMDATATRRS